MPKPDRRTAAQALVDAARGMYLRGWMDGTAGNLSMRTSDTQAVITASGRAKGELSIEDAVEVWVDSGRPCRRDAAAPSAETDIHMALYRLFAECGAVVHAHPPYCTLAASRAGDQEQVRFADYEFIKGLGADPRIAEVPLFFNWMDVALIARDVTERYQQANPLVPPAFLIKHHGATAWGPTLRVARNRLECLEALCRLAMLARACPCPEEVTT